MLLCSTSYVLNMYYNVIKLLLSLVILWCGNVLIFTRYVKCLFKLELKIQNLY